MDNMIGFREVVLTCAENSVLVSEFDRLHGTKLGQIGGRAWLEATEGNPTDQDQETMWMFVAFVYECVWTRLPEEAFAK